MAWREEISLPIVENGWFAENDKRVGLLDYWITILMQQKIGGDRKSDRTQYVGYI